MTLQLAIIADDLTGALDATAPFAAVPGGVLVATRPQVPNPSGAGVFAVSTRSRDVSAEEAQERVAAVLEALPAGVRIMKKVDSRLKGNIAAELEALPGPILAAPALPEFGRAVLDGAVTGFGVDRPIPVAQVLGPHAARAVIPDTRTPTDMRQALRNAPPGAVLVGARGLAVALAAEMRLAAPVAPRLHSPVCFAVGSTDPITLAQVAALRNARPDVVYIPGPSGQLPAPYRPPAPITLIQATAGPTRSPAEVARAFAETTAPYLQDVRSMLLTGGATAEAVLDVLGIDRLQLVAEALPGLPICIANGQIIVTKSGGFGGPDTFLRLIANAPDTEGEEP